MRMLDVKQLAGTLAIVGLLACTQQGLAPAPEFMAPVVSVSAAPVTADDSWLRSPRKCIGWKENDPCRTRRRHGDEKAIRGPDDRIDLHCLERAHPGVPDAMGVYGRSAAVAAMFFEQDVDDPVDGHHRLGKKYPRLSALSDKEGLCADEVFADQPRGAWCGAVLVDKRTMLMAAHCYSEIQGRKYAFVFDYMMPAHGAITTVPEASVCRVAQDPRIERVGNNLVLIEIACHDDFERTPASVAPAMPKDGRVYAIGFPRSLPAKFSGWGLMFPRGEDCFHARLDIFPGNSGSPVFDADHRLIGVMEKDESATSCEDPVRKCRHWSAIAEDSTQELRITSTHEIPARLERRRSGHKTGETP